MIFLKRVIRRMMYVPAFLVEAQKWKYESCQRCGSAFRVTWNIDDNIWNKVINRDDGGGGSYCVDCFVKMAEAENIFIESDNVKLSLFYPQEVGEK